MDDKRNKLELIVKLDYMAFYLESRILPWQ